MEKWGRPEIADNSKAVEKNERLGNIYFYLNGFKKYV